MKPIQQGDDFVIEWNGYKAVAPTEALCIRVFEEMLLENARADAKKARFIKERKEREEKEQLERDRTLLMEIKKFPHPLFRDNE